MPSELRKQILVVQTAFIGDVFLMVPLLQEIKKIFPNDSLIVVVREGLAEFLEKLKLADEVFELKKGNRDSYLELQENLKTRSFRYILSPHSSVRTALFIFPLRAERKISYSRWWNPFFFDIRIEKKMAWPEPMRQLQLLEPIWQQKLLEHFNLSAAVDFRMMSTAIESELLMTLSQEQWSPHLNLRQELLKKYHLETKRYVVIFPGSVWKTKQWTTEGFAQLAIQLEDSNFEIVLMGSAGEIDICNEIGRGLKNNINLAGQHALWESLLLLTKAQLVVCNDSGSMHMAALANVPTVAIFGPTVLSQGFRPWQNRASVIENSKLECRPCGKHGHRSCPLGHHECMKSISSALVFSACKRYI
jgi:heptosyltransferase-2